MTIDDIIIRLFATALLFYDALMFYWRFKGEDPFCHCGADMRGGKE